MNHSTELDWQFEDDLGSEPERAQGAYAAGWWWIQVVLLAWLVVLVVGGGIWLVRRHESDVFEQVRTIAQLEWKAAREGDETLYQTLQDAADGWRETQASRWAAGAPRTMPELGLQATGEDPVFKSLHLTQSGAILEVEQAFRPPDWLPGGQDIVRLRFQEVFRPVDAGWRHGRPEWVDPGEIQTNSSRWLRMHWYARDTVVQNRAWPALAELTSQLCADWHCPDDLQLTVTFTNSLAVASGGIQDWLNPGVLEGTPELQIAPGSAPVIQFSSPAWSGLPVDEPGLQAVLDIYRQRVILALLYDLVGRHSPGVDGVIRRMAMWQLEQYSFARPGWLASPVDAELAQTWQASLSTVSPLPLAGEVRSWLPLPFLDATSGGRLAVAEGMAAFDFLIDRYGSRAAFSLPATLREQPDLPRALARAAEVPLAEIETGWWSYLRSRARLETRVLPAVEDSAAVVCSRTLALLTPGDGLIRRFPSQGQPRFPHWSADGRHLAYFDQVLNQQRLLVVYPERGTLMVVSTDWSPAATVLGWSADEQNLFIDSGREVPNGVLAVPVTGGQAWGQARTFLSRRDGQVLAVEAGDTRGSQLDLIGADRQVTSLGLGLSPTWSADGAWLAFLTLPGIQGLDSASGLLLNLVRLTPGDESLRTKRTLSDGISPTWSPATNLLAFLNPSSTVLNVYDAGQDTVHSWLHAEDLKPALGAGLTRLGPPVWSPDGAWLVVAVTRLDGLAAGVAFVESATQKVRAWPVPSPVQTVHWSPDGAWLAYQSASDPGVVEVFRPETGPVGAVLGAEPLWSPDSQWLAIWQGESAGYGIYRPDFTAMRRWPGPGCTGLTWRPR